MNSPLRVEGTEKPVYSVCKASNTSKHSVSCSLSPPPDRIPPAGLPLSHQGSISSGFTGTEATLCHSNESIKKTQLYQLLTQLFLYYWMVFPYYLFEKEHINFNSNFFFSDEKEHCGVLLNGSVLEVVKDRFGLESEKVRAGMDSHLSRPLATKPEHE